VPQVIGLVIGTRPDCLDLEKLKYLQDLAQTHTIILEIGIESCYDASLKRMNRGHSYEQAVETIEAAAELGLRVGTHVIVGLPGETEAMLIESADRLSRLAIHSVKFHQLQLIHGTAMLRDLEKNPQDFRFYSFGEYCELMGKVIERLRPTILIERFFSEAAPKYNATPIQWIAA
jgi:radical SAM protein (TIGR01212 family)